MLSDFCDLARVLRIDKNDVSLGRSLSLALGSREHGNRKGGCYEPERYVINFTRHGDRGNMAHTLDNFIGHICFPDREGQRLFA